MERRKTTRKNEEKHSKKHNKINIENNETRTDNKVNILKQMRRFELYGVFLCLVAALSVLGIFGINAGFVGAKLASLLKYFFGVGALLSSSVLLLIGLYFITEHKNVTFNSRFWGFFLLFLLFLTLYHYWEIPIKQETLPDNLSDGGGLLGGGIVFILYKCFGETGSGIVIIAGLIASVLMVTNWSLGDGLKITREKGATYVAKGFFGVLTTFLSLIKRINKKQEVKKEEPFVKANLYDQDTDSTESKREYDDPAQKYIMSFMDGTQVPIKNKSEQIEDDMTDENNDDSSEKTSRNIVSYWKEESENPIDVTEDTKNNIEIETYIDAIEAEPSAGTISPSPQYTGKEEANPTIVPLSERKDTGKGENGFEVRSDAFRSRDEITAFPINNKVNETNNIDLSNPDFDDNDYQNENIAENKQTIELLSKEDKEAENTNYEIMNNFPPKSELNNATVSLSGNAANNLQVEPLPEKPYVLPEVTHILSKMAKKQNLALKIEIEDNARTLSKTLEDFKVKANIINACHGPAVTRYELEPAPGVKVSKITGLSEDLALALAATSIRIEPIPGKSAIGVEVPNKELEDVQLREVLEQPFFKDAESKLTVGLGMDIGGQAIFADLAKMPHLLIAGATGSGKSVCVNTLITSILFKAKPDEVKFILIDPKMVELSNYNGIPHLMVPVVTDAKKAASVLNWAVQEMEKRYSKFAEKVVRNMETYNSKFPEDKMPAIVIIIDELADLMMVAPHDVEDAICRLAQKARAAGIHLVLATQRPSVDVITGIIKANIPSRIAFAVSSQVDSRTILDSSGAEKLLGRGDMLFYPIGSPKPHRVQGAFVSDEEVEMLLDFIKDQGQKVETNQEIINFTEQAMLEDDKGRSKKDESPRVDELLLDAVELVISTGQASASNVQRRFRVGYARAGRLIDTMEMLGIVGPSNGSKPRDILMSMDDALEAAQDINE